MSEVSKGKKWSVNPFQTLKVQEMEYTYSSTNFSNYKKIIIWVIKEQNLHKFVLCWCSKINIGETWSFSLPCTWSKVSSTKNNHHLHFWQRSWFALARSLFYVDVPKWTSVKLDLFLAWHVIESHFLKEESSLIFSAKKLICIGEKFVPQTACWWSEVNK